MGSIKMEGMEKENIVRASEHVHQIPASQEELCSKVLRYAANQNGARACNIQSDWTGAHSHWKNQSLSMALNEVPFIVVFHFFLPGAYCRLCSSMTWFSDVMFFTIRKDGWTDFWVKVIVIF
jgi:hypothetical protein